MFFMGQQFLVHSHIIWFRVRWRNDTNWDYLNETSLYPHTGVLPWRGVYNATWKEFKAWMDAPPKEDPADEPIWRFADAINPNPGTKAVLKEQHGEVS